MIYCLGDLVKCQELKLGLSNIAKLEHVMMQVSAERVDNVADAVAIVTHCCHVLAHTHLHMVAHSHL